MGEKKDFYFQYQFWTVGFCFLRPNRFYLQSSFIPAFFRVLVSLVVELEGNLGVQADAEVVVHHALLGTLPINTIQKICRVVIKRWQNIHPREHY